MKVFKALVGRADAPEILKIDAIRWRGKLWLVPSWRVSAAQGVRWPQRLIRFDLIPHQTGTAFADFVLNEPIPMGILDGTASTEERARYEIVENPNLQIPAPPSRLS